ncbi:YueH family protein [Jeotgalibacillus aurantiacus]|uniref:YueH family protein n=1 Tax=Jeotgalibacillus aurantiacus TaxID=2763266 RepID=UPI001D0BC51B|nr:YueH family protein [Jeotgalibacillus aurantiacus]
MKIRKSYGSNGQRSVFIHENRKEETILIAIPSVHWSYLYKYEESGEETSRNIRESLEKVMTQEEASELSQRIKQWTSEM